MIVDRKDTVVMVVTKRKRLVKDVDAIKEGVIFENYLKIVFGFAHHLELITY